MHSNIRIQHTLNLLNAIRLYLLPPTNVHRMSDTSAALLFLIPAVTFFAICWFLFRFLVKQGRK